MLVSIIVNNYNYARFLRTAIDSALTQSYTPIEVLVVDDGSTDESQTIMRSYGDRIRPIYKPNGGQASSLGAGFAQCHGELVFFLDADDMLLPHAVQRVVDAFSVRPQPAKVHYRMQVIDEQGQPRDVIKPDRTIPLPHGDLRNFELSFPFDMPWLPTSGNAFAASVLRDVLPIPDTGYGQVGADWYLVHVSALYGTVAIVDDVCAYYRVHANNNYELAQAELNLRQIRQTIAYAEYARHSILEHARRLHLPNTPSEVLSVSYMAARLTSLKLNATQHPIRDDSILRTLHLALTAISRRSDVSIIMKLMFAAWFVCMALLPKPLAHRLAELFFFPEKRRQVNQWLASMHTSRGSS